MNVTNENVNIKLPDLTKEQLKHIEMLSPIIQSDIEYILKVMLFYINLAPDTNKSRVDKPVKGMIKHLEQAIPALKELYDLYNKKNKYVIIGLCSKPTIEDYITYGIRSNDTTYLGIENPVMNVLETIETQVYYLQEILGDHKKKEEKYNWSEQDSAIYNTLLDNIKSTYKTTYNNADIVKIAFTHIYRIFKDGDIENIKSSAIYFMGNFLKTIEVTVSLQSPIFNVYSISYQDSLLFEVSNTYLEDCGEPFYNEEGSLRYACLKTKSDKYALRLH